MTETNTERKISIVPYLYEYDTVPKIINAYCNDLWNSNVIENIEHASKLIEYKNVLEDDKTVKRIQTICNSIFKALREIPDLPLIFEGRIKSLISTEKKILTYQAKGLTLDQVRDFIGLRLILIMDNTETNIFRCYSIMRFIIEFCIKNGFLPCKHEPIIGTSGFDAEKHPDIIVPKHEDIKSIFKYGNYIKDYIQNPKNNGYQSLHVIFYDPSSRGNFEVQLRTLPMHMHAEMGSAKHGSYKKKKYGNSEILFERKKIKVKGYIVDDNDNLMDFAGLEVARQIFQRATPPY